MSNTNLTDITNLSDDALDVFLSVKAGEDCVTVDHLSVADRIAVAAALGHTGARVCGWAAGNDARNVEHGRRVGADVEGVILDRQDRLENGEI